MIRAVKLCTCVPWPPARRFRLPASAVRGLAIVVLAACPLFAQDEDAATDTGNPATAGRNLTDRYLLREKGMRALDDHIPAAAERFFFEYREAAGFEEPDFADATILLARARLQNREPEKAREALSHHAEKTPGVTDPYYLQGLRYWRGKTAFELGEWQEALKTVQPLAEAHADSEFRPQALELAGAACVAMAQFARAQEFLQALLQEFPDSESAREARISLVRAYLADERTELAAGLLDTLAGDAEGAVSTRARLYSVLVALQQNDPPKAYELYQVMQTEAPDSAEGDWWLVLSHLTTRLMEADMYEQALQVAPRAIAVAPDKQKRAEAQLRHARCLIELEQVELAINALKAFRKEHPDSATAIPVQFHLARLLRKTGNPLAAAEYFQAVVGTEDASPELRYRAAYQRGWCFQDAGDYRSAREAFSEAARLGRTQKQQAEAFLLAGDAAFQLEDYTKASLSYQAVADNFPGTEFAERARFRQASARMNAELYGNAAVVYKQFIDEFPNSELRQQAWLERGIALKRAGETEAAIDVLVRFAEQFPESDDRARALLEAALASATLGQSDSALALLGRVIEEGGSATARAHALYQRTRIRFAEADYDNAIHDAWKFLEDYAHLPMAADVYFWLGDHYANHGELAESEKYFRELYTKQPESELAPEALYEAAHIRFQEDNLDGTLELLQELRRQFPEARPRLLARVELLHGDVLAERGAFNEALPHFRQANSLVPETETGLAALGRAGDMLMATAGPDAEAASLEKALEYFESVASAQNASPALREKAVYRKAKAYEKMGNLDSAVAEYQDIVYGYDIDLKDGKVRDWFYFLRAGVDAARLLTLQDKNRQAARILERVASSGIPIPEEVAAKARQIRESHGLE